MLIGIDGNEANVEKKVGVSVYASTLLKYFQKKSSKDLNFKIYLKNRPHNSLPQGGDYFQYKKLRPRFLWSQIALPLNLFFEFNENVFFSPAHYAPRFLRFPSVVTIHDLSYLYYPQEFLKKDLYKLTNWTEYSVKKAKKVIAVSKTTKKDIIKFYNIPEDKIEVIYNGWEKNYKSEESSDMMKKMNLKNKKYLLYVGTVQPRKNLTALIKAFSQLIKEKVDFYLVIAGKKGWLYKDIFAEVSRHGIEKKVIFTDYLPDSDIAWLYKNAFAFVLPSLYEGFGIPILEAMSFDCPVLSSYSSSLPEIGGDACLYFDPRDESDIYEKIIALIENKELRKKMIIKGKERLKLFSWQKCAEETLAVLTKV